MMELGIHPSEKKVCFGQLLGMCDQITFPLGECCSISTWEQGRGLLSHCHTKVSLSICCGV